MGLRRGHSFSPEDSEDDVYDDQDYEDDEEPEVRLKYLFEDEDDEE